MRIFNPSRILRSMLLGLACWLASGQLLLAQKKAVVFCQVSLSPRKTRPLKESP